MYIYNKNKIIIIGCLRKRKPTFDFLTFWEEFLKCKSEVGNSKGTSRLFSAQSRSLPYCPRIKNPSSYLSQALFWGPQKSFSAETDPRRCRLQGFCQVHQPLIPLTCSQGFYPQTLKMHSCNVLIRLWSFVSNRRKKQVVWRTGHVIHIRPQPCVAATMTTKVSQGLWFLHLVDILNGFAQLEKKENPFDAVNVWH